MVFNLKCKPSIRNHVSYVHLKANQNYYDAELIKLLIHLTSSAHLYVIDYENKVSDISAGYRGYVPMKWMFQFFLRPIETTEIEFGRFLKDFGPVEKYIQNRFWFWRCDISPNWTKSQFRHNCIIWLGSISIQVQFKITKKLSLSSKRSLFTKVACPKAHKRTI